MAQIELEAGKDAFARDVKAQVGGCGAGCRLRFLWVRAQFRGWHGGRGRCLQTPCRPAGPRASPMPCSSCSCSSAAAGAAGGGGGRARAQPGGPAALLGGAVRAARHPARRRVACTRLQRACSAAHRPQFLVHCARPRDSPRGSRTRPPTLPRPALCRAGSTEGTIVAFRQRLAEVGAQLEAAKASNRQTDDNLGRGIDQASALRLCGCGCARAVDWCQLAAEPPTGRRTIPWHAASTRWVVLVSLASEGLHHHITSANRMRPPPTLQ